MISSTSLTHTLSTVRQQIEDLQLPTSAFAGIRIADGQIHLNIYGQASLATHTETINGHQVTAYILGWLEDQAKTHHLKIVAAGLSGELPDDLASRLWLELDIVPEVFTEIDSAEKLAVTVASDFNSEQVVAVYLDQLQEVHVAEELVTLADYEKITSAREMEVLREQAEQFRGKKLVFVSATPRGGGVALMRHALIRLYRLLGVDAHWHVLLERAEAFDITKTKFHNVLQAVADPEIQLTEDDKQIYDAWSAENAQLLKPVLESADVIVIDDPQPAGLIPHIRDFQPEAKILYRSHIQIESALANMPGTPQHTTWQFIWSKIEDHDGFISHPIPHFIPKVVQQDKIVAMPPTTDPLDGLNKPLSPDQTAYYLKLFNKILLENNQTPLDPKRDSIIQVARFDPSKGIPDVLESYRQLRERLIADKKPVPQLVIVGHGSIDDPDGVPIYNLIMEMLREDQYAEFAADIKVARLPHVDQLLNVLLRQSKVTLQLSHKEGFEIKVTEALMKGKPVISYRAGGIPLQIKEGVSGLIVDEVGNTSEVADHLYRLFTNEEYYQELSTGAMEHARTDVLTVPNALNWLYLANQVLEHGQLQTNGQHIRELLPLE